MPVLVYAAYLFAADPAYAMVCNRSWHLPGCPKLVWHPARLIKEGVCVDLSMDTLHLKYPLDLFGYEGSVSDHCQSYRVRICLEVFKKLTNVDKIFRTKM